MEANQIDPDGMARLAPGMAKKISLSMLVLGGALLWPVPLGGVFFLVTAAFGLAIASEASLSDAAGPA
jgi:hypothetical protein